MGLPYRSSSFLVSVSPPLLVPLGSLSLSLYSNLGEGNDMDTYATKLDAILRAKEEQLVALRAKLAAFQEQLAAEEQSRSQPRSGK